MKPTDITDFRKSKEDQPDSEHAYTDNNGLLWFKYVISYVDHNGVSMGFDLWATGVADAKFRLDRIGKYGTVDGQLFTTL